MTPIDLLLLATLATLWGGSYFFIRVAVPEFGPAALVALRVVIGGLLLWGMARALRRPIVVRQHLPRLAILGLLNAALPYMLISAAELHLTAFVRRDPRRARCRSFAAAFGARLLGRAPRARRASPACCSAIVGVAVMVGWGPMALDLSDRPLRARDARVRRRATRARGSTRSSSSRACRPTRSRSASRSARSSGSSCLARCCCPRPLPSSGGDGRAARTRRPVDAVSPICCSSSCSSASARRRRRR